MLGFHYMYILQKKGWWWDIFAFGGRDGGGGNNNNKCTMYNRSRQLLGRDRSVLSTKQALL